VRITPGLAVTIIGGTLSGIAGGIIDARLNHRKATDARWAAAVAENQPPADTDADTEPPSGSGE
jgi:hypothetical protein